MSEKAEVPSVGGVTALHETDFRDVQLPNAPFSIDERFSGRDKDAKAVQP